MKFFYNFCLKDERGSLDGDILAGVRKSYFSSFLRISDKITINSDSDCLSYEYRIEKDKPMKWSVKSSDGKTLEENSPYDDGRYYICCYRGEALYKRILFSRLHTLLKVEYYDAATGMMTVCLEPRKAGGTLCILYDAKDDSDPVVLYPAPSVNSEDIAAALAQDFSDYTVIASTDDGSVMFLTEAQLTEYRNRAQDLESSLANIEEESFIEGETPLFDNINAKDFNVKKNLAAGLDITEAEEFSFTDDNEAETSAEETAEDIASSPDKEQAVGSAEPAQAEEPAEEYKELEIKPDKLIMADGAMYSYYGELDSNGNRSGYGRTVTDEGRTAYEGRYLNDKRSGRGTYYYKDGSLLYTGDWAENARHGIGVGVSSRDGSIHVGKWSMNKPVGNGVRLTSDGDIRFVCKELSDGSTVLMNYMPDDTAVISKYDKNGKKLSEKTISLADITE